MSILIDYIEGQAKKKKITPQEWVSSFGFVGKCKRITHRGKFTNPQSKLSLCVKTKGNDGKGYVTTENSNVDNDIVYSSSSYMRPAGLLLLKLEDGQDVLTHLNNHDDTVIRVLLGYGLTESLIYESLEQMNKNEEPDFTVTEGCLKQVFFPVGDTDHILTILPASGLFETISRKIREMNNDAYEAQKDEKSPRYGKDCKKMMGCVTIGIGGSNAQNISYLNGITSGKGYLLPSMPPSLSYSELRYPTRNFFSESIPHKWTEDCFDSLKTLMASDYMNVHVREGIKDDIKVLANISLNVAEKLRQNPGWATAEKYKSLSAAQKLWLDPEYIEVEKDWIPEIATDFAKWVRQELKYGNKDSKITVGDAEWNLFSKIMKDELKGVSW